MAVEKDYIICDRCNHKFDRGRIYKHCCNCFACTGCEIYYCPSCDEEIIITPVGAVGDSSGKQEVQF
jgi:hypothetical protein